MFLTGYLGQDPKPKYFDSGKVVLNLSLAVKREYHPIEVLLHSSAYGWVAPGRKNSGDSDT